jgi:hypothetical protein
MPSMTTKQKVVCSFAPLKADDSPAEIDAASVTVVISGSANTLEIVDLVTTNESVSFALQGVVADDVGAKAVVKADADMGPGVLEITGETSMWTVTIDPSDMATHFGITEGAPEEATAAAVRRSRRTP